MNPYPGLRPFTSADSEYFFGREREIDELIERLAARRFLAVLGVSGCGKSSLVHAGLIPALRSGLADPLGGNWRILDLFPGSGPLEALWRTLDPGAVEPRNSSHALRDWARKQAPGEKILLLVDQFEEIFSYRDESLARDGGNAASLFVDQLLTAAREPGLPLYLILTMRSDYLGSSALFHGLAEALNDGSYLVPRLTRLQQQDAIERPAQACGAAIEPAVVQTLLTASAKNPDRLPILQHLLKRMWEERDGGPLDMAVYRKAGEWEHALNRDAEAVLAKFPGEQDAIRSLFQWITGPGTGKEPVRRRRPLAELPAITGLTEQRLSAVIAAFTERDFLVCKGIAGEQWLDLTHESVIWHWPALSRWVQEESTDALRLRLYHQAVDKQPLSGEGLAEARAIRDRFGARPQWARRYLETADAVRKTGDWISESERLQTEAAEEKRRSRRRQMTVLMAASVILAIAAALLWYQSNRLAIALRSLDEFRQQTGGASLETVSELRNEIARLKGNQTGQVKENPRDGLRYVFIPAGRFLMGCSPGDPECDSDEKPLHEVEITRPFWIGQTEVTQAAYRRVRQASPSHFKGDDRPVETVSWDEAKAYCEAVGMRLPTEAEWEYAARAGSTTARHGPIDQIAWYNANSGGETKPAAAKLPNAWGLYDTLGNVWEWVADPYGPYRDGLQRDPLGARDGSTRVLRGGSWDYFPRYVRVSDRYGGVATNRYLSIGFRCAGELSL